jgi:hypothetical protein
VDSIQWRQFWTIAYGGKGARKAAIIPIIMGSDWVRIEVTILTFPKPNWYLAGWLNQVYIVQGKPFVMPSVEVPFAPSLYRMPDAVRYQIKFSPVRYMPSSIVRFYQSV